MHRSASASRSLQSPASASLRAAPAKPQTPPPRLRRIWRSAPSSPKRSEAGSHLTLLASSDEPKKLYPLGLIGPEPDGTEDASAEDDETDVEPAVDISNGRLRSAIKAIWETAPLGRAATRPSAGGRTSTGRAANRSTPSFSIRSSRERLAKGGTHPRRPHEPLDVQGRRAACRLHAHHVRDADGNAVP